jgi:hypothetical protein
MEIPPPQYTSFPFIPLIAKQALRGHGKNIMAGSKKTL